jgi:PAS domain S-box-containing protein
MIVSDPEGRILDVNPSASRLLGYTRDELLTRHLTDIIHTDDMSRQPISVDRLGIGEAITRERLLVRRDGTTFPVVVSAEVLPDGTVRGVFRDARSPGEREERWEVASEDRFLAIFEQAPFSIVLYRADGSILQANQAASRMWGTDPDSTAYLLEHYNVLQDPTLDALGHGPFIRAAFDGEPSEIPLVRYDPEEHPFASEAPGRARWVRGHAYPIKDRHGRVREVAIIHEDMTAAKEEEERRVEIERQMLRGQKLESLGILAGGIAHDFSNLLTTILGTLGQAGTQLEEGSPLRALLADAEVAGRHASELCAQLLAYSGQGEVTAETIDLSSLVQEMTAVLRVSIPKSAHLERDPAVGLPPIRANVGQVRQVVLNLITNAADAVAEMGGDVAISTGTVEVGEADIGHYVLSDELRPGEYVYLEVADTGVGMSPEAMERIFDPFYSTKAAGRGLGLSAVLGIIRHHGGAVRVSSTEGQGTAFRVLFPIAVGEDAGEHADSSVTEADPDPASRGAGNRP